MTLLSGIKFTECGVPQGYILGPLLFIIYIMIFQITSKQTTILADDTALLCSGNDKDDLKSNIITNLENVETLVLSQQTLLI